MITLICTVLFCLGWRMVTDEGQILYFIKRPFVENHKRLEHLIEMQNIIWDKDRAYEIAQRSPINFLGKPFVLCITCMASFWGATVFIYLNGITIYLIPAMLFNCIAASFIQTFIWNLYVKLD